VDSSNEKIIKEMMKSSEITSKCPMYSFSCELNPILNQNTKEFASTILKENEIDHIISIERFGKTENGKYYSMRAMDLSNSCGDIDIIFELAKTLKIPTTSIGDGGNELGMGKAIYDVKKYIKNGETIACCVPCDYLIIAGVSNWGGLAISSFLFLLSDGEKKLSDYLVTVDDEFKLLECLVKSGSIDGVSGKSELTVDGLDYWDCHAKVLQEIINICEH
jgi:hypothetical protein